jgi:carboxymethylenebutenolidase
MVSSHVNLTPSDGGAMQAYTATPDGSGPFPEILVFQEAFGVNHHIRVMAERFAEEGYIAIAPELFHRSAPAGWEAAYDDFASVRPHMAKVTPEGIKADATAAFEWLRAQPKLRKDAIASIGWCMGGRASFLANLALPLQAAVSYYGGGIAPELIKGAPNLHAPMLFFWGGRDKHIGPDQTAAVVAALRAASKPFINVEISDAEHGFACDERPSYNRRAAREAWNLTLSFLSENLEPSRH